MPGKQALTTEQKLRNRVNGLYVILGAKTEEIEVLKEAIRDFEHRLMALAAQHEKLRVENDKLKAAKK